MKKHSLLPLLSCLVSAGALHALPMQAAPQVASHPPAYELLKNAYQARQTLPSGFAGFDAKITYTEGAQSASGIFHYRPNTKSAVQIDGLNAEDQKWVQHNVRSILVHRTAQDFDKADGAHPLQFGAESKTNPGRLIVRGDDPHLNSRVKNGKITELVRVEENWLLTITVQQTAPADPGKYLNTKYTVAYHDKNTGELQRVDIFEDHYIHIKNVWLPSSRQVRSFGAELTPRFRTIHFTDVHLLTSNP